MSAKSDMLTQGISLANDCGNMEKNACMVLMPGLPKDSSVRGLWDEERQITENLFSYKQDVETRFVDLFTRSENWWSTKTPRQQMSGWMVSLQSMADQLRGKKALRPLQRQCCHEFLPCFP